MSSTVQPPIAVTFVLIFFQLCYACLHDMIVGAYASSAMHANDMIINPYCPTIYELQVWRRRVVYDTTVYLRYAKRELGESNLYVLI